VISRRWSFWAAALATVLLTCWTAVMAAPAAVAASADRIDSLSVVAAVDEQGYLHVTETFVWRFGSSSGRHGITRTLITREPDGSDYDMVYRIDQVQVSSPDSQVSTELQTTEQGTGREQYLQLRIGSADRTVSADTATYVISYRELGLLRSVDGVEQLYWDVTGSSMPTIDAVNVEVSVPGGAQQVVCSIAAPGKTGNCDSADIAGAAAEFSGSVPTGELLTVGVRLASGAVSNPTVLREENADAAASRKGAWQLGGSIAVAALVPFAGWAYLRRRTRDYRFDGLPPGTFPPKGMAATEVLGDPKLEIPVCFAPPPIAVAEAGLLIDGETQVRDTTATLVSLAVQGAIRLRSDEVQSVELVDPSLPLPEPERVLLRELFPRPEVGRHLDLGEAGTLTDAHELVGRTVLKRSTKEHWFARHPGGVVGPGSGFGKVLFPLLVFGFIGANILGSVLILMVPVFASGVVTWLVVRAKLRRGQRTGVGRALTDQIEGFRLYLATAEAEQLQFEEGEDIFSKYLPWAVMFDLTERWTRVCERLVELGRIPDLAPTWYYGPAWSLNTLGWQLNQLDTSVLGSVAAAAPAFSSDTGFGSGGSAFGGGGFGGGGGFSSGGGGGGGGAGSW
jgi:Predicted membrane protein